MPRRHIALLQVFKKPDGWYAAYIMIPGRGQGTGLHRMAGPCETKDQVYTDAREHAARSHKDCKPCHFHAMEALFPRRNPKPATAVKAPILEKATGPITGGENPVMESEVTAQNETQKTGVGSFVQSLSPEQIEALGKVLDKGQLETVLKASLMTSGPSTEPSEPSEPEEDAEPLIRFRSGEALKVKPE